MLSRPRFKPHLHVTVLSADEVLLVGERGSFALRGESFAAVAPLLDGTLSPAEIAASLAGRLSRERIQRALTELERRGLVTESDPRLSDPAAAFWSAQGFEPAAVADRIATSVVRLAAVGVDGEPVARALAQLGVTVEEDAHFGVVVVDDYLNPALAEHNRRALEREGPWLLARPLGLTLWFGPHFRPGATGCWECLASRLRDHRAVEELARAAADARDRCAVVAAVPTSVAAAAALLAGEVARLLLTDPAQAPEAQVVTLDLASLTTTAHPLPRIPQCRACGDPGLLARAPAPIELDPAPVDGMSGKRDPDETVRRYGHLVSPITGVVRHLERAALDPTGTIHLCRAGPVPGDHGQGLAGIRASLRHGGSMGRGTTASEARAGALCEGIERYSGIYRPDRHTIRASYHELAGEAIHPDVLLQFSHAQRRDREAAGDNVHSVPDPFDEQRQVEWTAAWSLAHRTFRYLPTAHCFFDYLLPDGHRFCRGDSNGAAAGSTQADAILHGFLELVERDAFAMWWYNRVSRPGIDLATAADPFVGRALTACCGQRREVWALDLTADLGIPVVAALSRRSDDGTGIVFGSASHPDPEVALGRAMTEMFQMLGHSEVERPPRALLRDRRLALQEQWLRDTTWESDPWLAPGVPGTPIGRLGSHALPVRDDPASQVARCVELAAAAGIETLVVDQTLPDIAMPVVKVVAPGLRHFWPRLAPGRLFEVPVALGWLPAQTPEDRLNPVPVFW